MRMALAQINPTIGDIAGNMRLIAQAIEQAGNAGAQLLVFPELALLGYPPRDLLLKPALIDECEEALAELARQCDGLAAVIGYPCRTEEPQRGRPLYNAAALCQEGKVVHRHFKALLPSYDVFDEHRYFEPGHEADVVDLHGWSMALTICEDLWNEPEIFERQLYHAYPVRQLADAGASLLINIAASPYVMDKHLFRQRLMGHIARQYRMPVVYCNQVGGNDELIFDGNSCVYDAQGRLLAQAKDFEPDLLVVDLPAGNEAQREAAPGATPRQGIASLYHALVLGIRDYCRKCGFKSAVLGLSGGIDSALVGALAVAALGRDNVRGVAMPSRYSSEGSVADARALADNLGFAMDVLPIAGAHEAFEAMLAPSFEGRPPDTTEENLQARIRGATLMAYSNKFGSLLITTGNKSELAVGYCTLYGDMCGGLAAISDVPKLQVWALARWINEDPQSPLRRQYGKAVIPENSITKPPSAELRPDQRDQDSLPPYEVLDEIVDRYVVREQHASQIIEEAGFDPELVLRIVRLIDFSEYKRRQAAPGLKVSGRAFGIGRRMPIAQRYDNRRLLKDLDAPVS